MLEKTILAFVPIFVAVDAVGTMPIFLSLTGDMSRSLRRRTIFLSMWTAISVAIGFIFVGKALFNLLGITIGDFMIAGGAILFSISIMDLLHEGKERKTPHEGLGIVPLGTPLMAGPAVLTTSLISIDQYGTIPTLISVVGNILVAGLLLYYSDRIVKVLGRSGMNAVSKIIVLLLAAIAVMMMRKGLTSFLVSIAH
ncbi:MAG: MarC family protein [Candidatus Omnitrophota bacterium]